MKYKSPDKDALILIRSFLQENWVILIVSDNGLGIPSNKIPVLFGMFKRFHNHVEGTGVGLYIVKRIVENSGGKIEVESEVGKGTTFTIYLKQ